MIDRLAASVLRGRRARAVGVGLLLATTIPIGAASEEPKGPASPGPLWYQIALGGEAAGWMKVVETVEGERRITETGMELTVARGGTEVRMEMSGRFVETLDGEPIEAWSRQVMGPKPIETTYIFADDHIRVHTRQGDRDSAQERPLLEGEWVPPGAAQALLRAALEDGAEVFTSRSVDPLLGLQIVETTWERVDDAIRPMTVPAGTYETSRWQQRTSATPGLVATVDLDSDGTMIASSTPFMGTTMSLVMATRAFAQSRDGVPELMASSFIYPDRPLPSPRTLRRAVYRVRSTDGTAPDLPTLGRQQVTRTADTTVVAVDLDRAPGSTEARNAENGGETLDGQALAPYLETSVYLDHQSPAVRDLLQAVPATGGKAARAEALRRFVHGHLDEKNLDALLATAVEVAESRSGDCTEHSVLLAALLRAEGIASRVVTGLIYVDRFVGAEDLFAYHMWTQAYVDHQWVDLDATLERPFDAAHIAFATSALADDQAALVDLASIVPMFGNLSIEVVEPEG